MDALDLVVRSLLRPGDVAVVEDPGFPPVLDLLEARDIEVVGVPVDDSGLSIEGLERALAQRPSVVFVQPRGQNPTGISMTPTRARRLARLLAGSGAFVVEDDSAGDVAASESLSLGTWLPAQVLHVRSFSKSYGPDLRIAAVSGPEDLLAPMRRTRALGQGWTSRLLQRVLTTLLTDPETTRQVERARGEYARRRELVVRRLLDRGVEVPGTDGLNIWVPVRDESAAVLRLASQGVAVTPGSPFHVEPPRGPAGHVRVTTGIIRRDHEAIADLIADAALVGAWTAQHR
jgi:DNA-binding transcriptional MocR family regulator